jgi:Spy/CpxP family protein refolding chaperone
MKSIRALSWALLTISATGCLAARAENASVEPIDAGFEKTVVQHVGGRFYKRIKADDQQRAKISAIVDKQLEDSRALRQEIRLKACQLKELLGGDLADDEQILAKAEELRQLRQRIMEQRLQVLLAVRKELTGQQKKLISQRIDTLLGRVASAPVGL